MESDDYFFDEWCLNSEVENNVSEIVIDRDVSKGFVNKIPPEPLNKNKTRDSWYEKHSLDDGYASWDDEDEMLVESITEEPAFKNPSLGALWSMGSNGEDTRPHLYDKKLKQYLLLDSGAQISACPPDPGDKPDPSITLRAANGSKMQCFGTKDLTIQIIN